MSYSYQDFYSRLERRVYRLDAFEIKQAILAQVKHDPKAGETVAVDMDYDRNGQLFAELTVSYEQPDPSEGKQTP